MIKEQLENIKDNGSDDIVRWINGIERLGKQENSSIVAEHKVGAMNKNSLSYRSRERRFRFDFFRRRVS